MLQKPGYFTDPTLIVLRVAINDIIFMAPVKRFDWLKQKTFILLIIPAPFEV